MKLNTIHQTIQKLSNKKKAQILQRFFKTGKGEYGEGDIFLGVRVPEVRKLARRGRRIKTGEVQKLLRSNWVDVEEGRRRKYYKLTAKGRKALESKRDEWFQFSAGVNGVLGSGNVVA